jgi:hypothetical protein
VGLFTPRWPVSTDVEWQQRDVEFPCRSTRHRPGAVGYDGQLSG